MMSVAKSRKSAKETIFFHVRFLRILRARSFRTAPLAKHSFTFLMPRGKSRKSRLDGISGKTRTNR